MNQYGGLDALMALSQLSPEQFQTGLDRMSQIQQRYTPQTQQPTMTQATGGNPYTQPTMTQANDAEGGFGTGANPYTQPYYQRQFGQGYQPATGYRTALYGQYRPMGGALFGQNMGSYSPYGMGGGKGGGYNPYGGYGYYGGYGPFGGQSGGKGGAI
jgi:hypothetical protein